MATAALAALRFANGGCAETLGVILANVPAVLAEQALAGLPPADEVVAGG